MTDSNNRTSLLVSGQLPAFVREEHETFVKFLEHYYHFLEQDGGQLYVAKNFNRYLDIDIIKRDVDIDDILGEDHTSREESDYHNFLQKMYDVYIKYIPDNILLDKSLFVKHAKDFYRARGSEKSVRFLMRALFNKEVEFYYPKSDIIRASDGKWFIEKSLKVTDIKVNNVANSVATSIFESKLVKGQTSGATAIVERIDTYFDKGELITELKLSGLTKDFQQPETIFCYYTEEGVDKFLSATLFSGVVTAVTINNGGAGYTEGTTIPVITSTGTGAQVIVSRVSKGQLQAVGVVSGGCGFKINDFLVVAGSGSGASGNVSNVNTDGTYHPNSYDVMWTTINLEANTPINSANYANLVPAISDPANAWITNSMSYFAYSNCGPVVSCSVTNGGNNYAPPISISISANSIISKLGIIGRMEIMDGGTGYTPGDLIIFVNPPGSTGSGAQGNVKSVNATGSITGVEFKQLEGEIIGGSGYDWLRLPLAQVVSGTGSGANIAVTGIIGHNESLIQSLSNIGVIQAMTVVSGGSSYKEGDYLDLTTHGDGTANAVPTIVTGAFSYPGRYINDDGHVSGYNFMEDRDYYQEFSYVVKINETTNKYRSVLKELTHPAGTKMFGEYVKVFDQNLSSNGNITIKSANTVAKTLGYDTFFQVQGFEEGMFNQLVAPGNANAEIITTTFVVNTTNHVTTFVAQNNSIIVGPYENSGFVANDKIFLWFQTNASINIPNTNYTVIASNGNYMTIRNPLTETSAGNTGIVRVYNPDIRINMPHGAPVNGENIYLSWSNSYTNVDTSLANGFYTAYEATGVSFNVCHPSMITILATPNTTSNTVNVTTRNVIIHPAYPTEYAKWHNYQPGDNVHIDFINGDSANAVNGIYTITGANGSNSFNVTTAKTLFQMTKIETVGKNATILLDKYQSIFYSGGNNKTAYVSFDNTNKTASNTVYTLETIGSVSPTNDVIKIVMADATKIPNTRVRLWTSQNNYSNIKFTSDSTDLDVADGQPLRIEFLGGAEDLANGVYNVDTVYATSNTFNIAYAGNAYTRYFSVDPGNTYNDTIIYAPVKGTGKEFELANIANLKIVNPGVNVKAGYVTFTGGSGTGANARVDVMNNVILFANTSRNILRSEPPNERFTLEQANLVNGAVIVFSYVDYLGTPNVSVGVTYSVKNATSNTFQVANAVTGNVVSLANVQFVTLSTSNTENLSYVWQVTLNDPGYGYMPGDNVSAFVYGSNANATFTVTLQGDGNTVFRNTSYTGVSVSALSKMEGTAIVEEYK